MAVDRSMVDNVILVDNAGWGDLILGAVVGALRLSDQEYVERRIPTSSFQLQDFNGEKYLHDAAEIAEEIADVLKADEGTVFKICSGKVLSRILTCLKDKGFNVEAVEETGDLQELVERSYVEWCVEAGVPRGRLDARDRFWRLLDWVAEKPETRGKLVKAGWGIWQLGFVNHETLMKVARVIGGEEGAKIVGVLSHVYETQDTEIVAKTGIRLKTVRKILYKLYDHSIAGLRRHRDKDTGWFIFHWRLRPDQIDGFLTNQKRRILEKLQTRLDYEKNHDFYCCQTLGCRCLTFEEAAEYVFRCPECDKPQEHYDNKRIIRFLSKKISQLKSELS